MSIDLRPDTKDICNLITNEAISLLHATDADSVGVVRDLRAGMKALASASETPADISANLAWIDRDLNAVLEDSENSLLDDERLLPVPSAGMLLEVVWAFFNAAVRTDDPQARETLLETARTVTEMGGLEDEILRLPEREDRTYATFRGYAENLALVREALENERDTAADAT